METGSDLVEAEWSKIMTHYEKMQEVKKTRLSQEDDPMINLS